MTESATYLGINNENEFYSHYYLSQVFAKDVKETLDGWAEREKAAKEAAKDGYRAPFNRLKALKTSYFAMQEQLKRERGAKQRVEMQRTFFEDLLTALGYTFDPCNLMLEDQSELPILAKVTRGSLTSSLIVLGAYDEYREGIDPLALSPHRDQYHGEVPPDDDILGLSWNELITKRVFAQDHPPRWVILLSDKQLLLIDRHKWNQNRLLRFEWDEILGRRDEATLKATTVLLYEQSLLPDDGICLLDSLDENAHKHAFEVSEDLKYALRECIELLGNEAADYLITHTRTGYTGKEGLDANKLTRECLRYMYRLLFLFYIEARPELGYVPHQSDAYRLGYSLERLRDLELVRLESQESRDGGFIHQSIQHLFDLIHSGYEGVDETRVGEADLTGDAIHNSFCIESLDSHLFNPKYTPDLNKVVFRNETLQRVIKLMSLTRPGGSRKRRGRVSYAQLGINQLGAVYEALLSYRGFFADQDLYEVKKAGTEPDELETSYFVSQADLEQYTDEEKVYDKNEDGQRALRKFSKGTFIYRLAGRDRQKSASYYTPEVLTKCLVKYALKELLQDKSADEVLELTICEPAMGSAAFLNEAVNQLSEAYLERKQGELNERIPHDDYGYILQQVKMYIADRNTFGVDLNPVAVELAEVSLWLNAIYEGRQVPWFGYQLFAGNSLIGARRQVYDVSLLGQRPKGQAWYDEAPVRLNPFSLSGNEEQEETKIDGLPWKRSATQIYHFLLPDPGMANYTDRVARSLEQDNFEKIRKWRKEFSKPFAKDDIDTLLFLSQRIDELWAEHAKQLAVDRERTEDELAVWPNKQAGRITSTSDKDKIHRSGIFNVNSVSASAYRRLKAAMDYWCALWFWPINQAALLPDRASFLMEMSLILSGDVISTRPEQSDLLFEEEVEVEDDEYPNPKRNSQVSLDISAVKDASAEYKDQKGRLKIEELVDNFPRLGVVETISTRSRYFHWELSFADIFSAYGGFDLVLGNPPWIKIEWEEAGVLADASPLFEFRGYSATELSQKRESVFSDLPAVRDTWFFEYEAALGTQCFLNAKQNFEVLAGQKANLYKCFLPVGWAALTKGGVCGFLHPEGPYEEPNGRHLRSSLYRRLKMHYQFQNELLLFPDVDHHTRFSINIYGDPRGSSRFLNIANLFSPTTVDDCYLDTGGTPVPGIKNSKAKWEVIGHRDRIVEVTETELGVFAQLYDDTGVPAMEARLPAVHCIQYLEVLELFVAQPRKMNDLEVYINATHWNERNAQDDGTIRKETEFPLTYSNLILSGPHFHIGNPFYKTPRAVCKKNSDYDVIDLNELTPTYIPRTNFFPSCSDTEYARKIPKVNWISEQGKSFHGIDKYFRLAITRGLGGGSGERSLQAAIVLPDLMHIDGVVTATYRSLEELVVSAALCASVPYDFFVKSTGRSDIRNDLFGRLPFPDIQVRIRDSLVCRYLGLNCLTESYAELWSDFYQPTWKDERWSTESPQLSADYFSKLEDEWSSGFALRSDFERRQALLEIDVLVSMALELSLEDLLTIYRIQFPVMKQYEKETYYDVNGRIVFTPSKGLGGVGLKRNASRSDVPLVIEYSDSHKEEKPIGWKDISPRIASHESPGQPETPVLEATIPDCARIHRNVIDDTLPGGPREKTITYESPFYLPNRESDYRIAWEVFDERFQGEVE